MRGLRDKVIVVAGGGTGADGPGNGAATAIRLAEEGAHVVVGDLDPEAARATSAAIEASGGVAAAIGLDVADETSVGRLVSYAVETFGGVDGLHVNAADMGAAIGADTTNDAVTLPIEVWTRTIDVNLTGFLLLVKAAIPQMLERGGGSIVTTTSDAAFIGEPCRVAYATTKAGLLAMTRHVASRWGPQGVRCNSIAPGLIARDDERDRQLNDRFGAPLRSWRHGRASDVAAVASFLLSADGEWVNGQVWTVNGGQYLR